MKSLLLVFALTSVALAADPFYPKATGQGTAESPNGDAAKFSLLCAKTPPTEYQNSVRGGIKLVVNTKSGVVRTINMPQTDEADFLFTRCTLKGNGTLTIAYPNGKVSKYEGLVRATVFDRTTDAKGHPGQSDAISVSFQGTDLKIPQAQFEGIVKQGHIQVTHPPYAIPGRKQANPPVQGGSGGDNRPPQS